MMLAIAAATALIGEAFLKMAAFIACLALIVVTLFGAGLLVVLAIAAVIWLAIEALIHFLLVSVDVEPDDDGDDEIELDDE